jgi:MFS family permease
MKKRLAIAQLMRHREPTLLVSGQAVSAFGDGVALVALTLLVLEITHNNASMLSWFVAARMIPFVAMLLVGGAVVDRFSRRTLMLLSDSARALLTGLLAALMASGSLRYWELIVFGVLFGLFDSLFTPAMGALVPEIVPEDLLGAMNSLRPLTGNLVGNMLGPAVGGLLAGYSTTLAILVDCASFVVSAVALAAMKPTPRPVRTSAASLFGDIGEGLRFVRSRTWIWTTLAAVTIGNAFVYVPTSVLIPYLLRHNLHVSKVYVGYAFAISGVAGALGALVSSNLKIPRRRVRRMWTYWSIGTLSALIFTVATNVYEVFVVALVMTPMMILGNVIWETMMQSEVPTELLGRVNSVDWFVSLGISPIGIVVAGSLAASIGVRAYYLIFSLVATVPGLVILASRRANAVDAGRSGQVESRGVDEGLAEQA